MIEDRDALLAHESPPAGEPLKAAPRCGSGQLAFERAGAATVLRVARAESPLRLLTPRNHGHAA